ILAAAHPCERAATRGLESCSVPRSAEAVRRREARRPEVLAVVQAVEPSVHERNAVALVDEPIRRERGVAAAVLPAEAVVVEAVVHVEAVEGVVRRVVPAEVVLPAEAKRIDSAGQMAVVEAVDLRPVPGLR